MVFMAVKVCMWHLWLLSSTYVIDACGGLYIYGIYGCGGLHMAFMVVEFSVCH